MKKVIALTSLFFLLLVGVLPQYSADAAGTYTATVTISGKEYKIPSQNNSFTVNLDDLVQQYNLNETDKVEKVLFETPDGAQSIILVNGETVDVVDNKVEIVVADVLGTRFDKQQDGVSISTIREFLYPVNNKVTVPVSVVYGVNQEEILTLGFKATKELSFDKGTPVTVSGLTLTTNIGDVQATALGGNKFLLNLAAVSGAAGVQGVKLTSDTAATVSVFSNTSVFYREATDVKFLNKEAVLDNEKVAQWGETYGISVPSMDLPVQILKDLLNATELTTLRGVVADANGNQSSFTVNIQTYGWALVDNKWFYYNKDGEKLTGWQVIDGKSYEFAADGAMKTGWTAYGSKWYFLGADGAMVVNKWIQSGAKWYYMGTDGAMLTNAWVQTGSKWYYVDNAGVMLTNTWVKSGAQWYYVGQDGKMLTNTWVLSGAKWYFMGTDGAMVVNKWVPSGKLWYYMGADGAHATGWVYSGGAWYFMNNNGVMTTGWVHTGGKWYFMHNNGTMATGWVVSGGKWYYLNSNGTMASNTTIQGYKLGKDGAWVR
jgi:glucan-binding YG repeat protein